MIDNRYRIIQKRERGEEDSKHTAQFWSWFWFSWICLEKVSPNSGFSMADWEYSYDDAKQVIVDHMKRNGRGKGHYRIDKAGEKYEAWRYIDWDLGWKRLYDHKGNALFSSSKEAEGVCVEHAESFGYISEVITHNYTPYLREMKG